MRQNQGCKFDGAYGMLNDLEKMNLKPTANMYNAILRGYFREVVSFVSSDAVSILIEVVSFVSSDAFAIPVLVALGPLNHERGTKPGREHIHPLMVSSRANLSKLSGLVVDKTSSSEDLHERSSPSWPKTANNGRRFARSVNEVELTRKQDRKHYTRRVPFSHP
ncbi:hypothetical protein FEM48_Zijuj04G0101900 [Ziziphus jujuba var. spinosa]|uniref:Uncharacterized protein n=1 Tax=Ziziphus jujuba var. spinosa TaxID=714518 RepID=A0A978VJA1_ZIZJJ|nr:hypothetical protein FEM48_Zijuj04G0101900 [Ziziphus jujuba var. spinosa]